MIDIVLALIGLAMLCACLPLAWWNFLHSADKWANYDPNAFEHVASFSATGDPYDPMALIRATDALEGPKKYLWYLAGALVGCIAGITLLIIGVKGYFA